VGGLENGVLQNFPVEDVSLFFFDVVEGGKTLVVVDGQPVRPRFGGENETIEVEIVFKNGDELLVLEKVFDRVGNRSAGHTPKLSCFDRV